MISILGCVWCTFFVAQVIDNKLGQLCAHYPSELIVMERELEEGEVRTDSERCVYKPNDGSFLPLPCVCKRAGDTYMIGLGVGVYILCYVFVCVRLLKNVVIILVRIQFIQIVAMNLFSKMNRASTGGNSCDSV